MEDLKAMWLDLRTQVDKLAAERQHYVDFFEQATEAYVVTDSLGMISDVNGAAVDVLLRRRRDLCGKPLAALVALDHRRQFRERLSALGGASTGTGWRTVVLTPDARIEIDIAARRIGGPGGGICWRLQAAH